MSLVQGRPWNRNIHYHGIVLSALPPRCGRVLDVGCGDGLLASELAERCDEVVAIDLDAQTLARARSRHVRPNLRFVEGDVMDYPFEPESFDAIASIATLHHLALEPALERLERLLRPEGVLAVIGLYRLHTLGDYAWVHAALPVSWWLRMTRNYEEVAAPIRDPDLTLAEIAASRGKVLPGAAVTRELLFRYSLVWRKASG